MPQIVVTIDAKTYRMACAEGEEDHLHALAAEVDKRVAELRVGFGEIGDQRLTVMAAIMATDELHEARERIAALEAAESQRATKAGREVLAETMNGMSDALERLASRLEGRN